MKNVKNYYLIDGHLEINNSTLKIKYSKYRYALKVLKFFGSISMIYLFIKKTTNYQNITGIYENIKFWIFGFASIYLFYLFFYSLFKIVWINKIELNDIVKIEVENDEGEDIDEDSKIEITLIKNNGRKKIIELQKEKNQFDPFLDEIKKRNSRIQIEYL